MNTFARRWLSSYRLSFPKTLVYMLQASEYDVSEYLHWYRRVDNYSKVTNRGKLKKTKKSMLLLGMALLIIFTSIFTIAITAILLPEYWQKLCIIIIGLGFIPSLTTYGLVVSLWLGKILVQNPKEKEIIAQTKQKLSQHSATKIAVAGSYGKTTMREILATVLSAGKKVASPPDSYNTPLGIGKFTQKLNGDEEVLVFEFGEHYPGDVAQLCEMVEPDLGVVTGVNEAHLERFKDISTTQAAIFELADYLGKKPVYVNAESKLALQKAQKYSVILYSIDGCDDWNISNVNSSVSGITFIATYKNKKIHATSALLGEHQIGPLVCAITIADKLGLSPKQIEQGLASTKPFKHRMQPRKVAGAIVVDDTYNGNLDGVRVGLAWLKSIPAKRKLYVTPGLVEQGTATESVHIQIGQYIAGSGVDKVVLMHNSTTQYIRDGLKKAKFTGEVQIEHDPKKFYTNIDQFVANGDVVLMQNDWPDNYS